MQVPFSLVAVLAHAVWRCSDLLQRTADDATLNADALSKSPLPSYMWFGFEYFWLTPASARWVFDWYRVVYRAG